MANSFSDRLIEHQVSTVSAKGAQLKVRLPWYRSLPLSNVEVAELRVDGESVPAEAVRFVLNGKRFELSQLPELTNEWWYVLDSALLEVDKPLSNATQREVLLTLALYPPYIPGLTWLTKSVCTLRAHAPAI